MSPNVYSLRNINHVFTHPKISWSNNNSIYEIMNWASRGIRKRGLWRFADGLFAINWLDYHVEMNSSSPVPQHRWLPQTFHIGWRKSFSYLHRAVSESEDAPFADNVYSPPLLLKRTGKLMIGKDRSLVLSIEVTKGISKRQRPSLLQQIGVAFPLKCCPIRDAGAFKSAR